MKYFRYIIDNDEIAETKGEVETIPSGFIEYEATLSGEKVYYKIVNTKITEVIGEGFHEETTRRRVDEFLSAFDATPPGAW